MHKHTQDIVTSSIQSRLCQPALPPEKVPRRGAQELDQDWNLEGGEKLQGQHVVGFDAVQGRTVRVVGHPLHWSRRRQPQ